MEFEGNFEVHRIRRTTIEGAIAIDMSKMPVPASFQVQTEAGGEWKSLATLGDAKN